MSGGARAEEELDADKPLPARNVLSLVLLIGLSGLNAFNDNLLKMLLVGLAPKVDDGTLGQDIGLWLGAIILLPFILFAPVAGFLSDRFSKRGVILAMLALQSLVLVTSGVIFKLEPGRAGVVLALAMFFVLAVQSTLFSPAKMGILKELGGSRRLGMLSGWLQMVTMIGILGGLSLGGPWFDSLFRAGNSAWEAAAQAVWVLFAVSLGALLTGTLLQRTRAHAQLPFRTGVLLEHFKNLRETLARRELRLACAGVAIYWFVGSMGAAMFVDAGLLLHPEQGQAGAATAASRMTMMVGIGTAVGSLLVARACRKKVELGIVPLGALGMVAMLAAAGWWPPSSGKYDASLLALGLCSALYMVPVQAFIQDRADAAHRGRVLSSMNLLNSLAGVAAIGMLFTLKGGFGLGLRVQYWALAALMLVVSWRSLKLLTQEWVRFCGSRLLRLFYQVRPMRMERVPESGGVLMLPNHVSYVDALILSLAFERPVRFVIWEPFYKVRWLRGLLSAFGAVPIAPQRAKEGLRRVADALRAEELVCLFPEGQLTRHGMLNEMRRGFEMIARQAHAPALAVYQDGLWGSLFSFERGRFFFKRPHKLRRPVSVWVSEPRAPAEVSVAWLDAEMRRLGSEAFLSRPIFTGTKPESWPALANALRLAETRWHEEDETLWLCDGGDLAVREALEWYVRMRRDVRLCTDAAPELGSGGKVVAIGGEEALQKARVEQGDWSGLPVVRVVWVRRGMEALGAREPVLDVPVFPAWLTEDGAWAGLSVPDPYLPPVHYGEQPGNCPGTLGRLLPGWRCEPAEGGLMLADWHPGDREPRIYPGLFLNEHGFLMPQSSGRDAAKNSLPLR